MRCGAGGNLAAEKLENARVHELILDVPVGVALDADIRDPAEQLDWAWGVSYRPANWAIRYQDLRTAGLADLLQASRISAGQSPSRRPGPG